MDNYNKNIYFEKGSPRVIGYKTFRGMVSLFKKINKKCKKTGTTLKFEIILPIKD